MIVTANIKKSNAKIEDKRKNNYTHKPLYNSEFCVKSRTKIL